MTKVILTQDKLKELLNYNPETGIFTRAINSGRNDRWKKGTVVGCLSKKNGYINIGLFDKRYYAHRLAWLYVYGESPSGEVDHINHVRHDNKISNLRSVDKKDNCKNKSILSNNTSGTSGVWWRGDRCKWVSNIGVNGKNIYLGCYQIKQDAINARKKANVEYGFHENHGV